MAMPSGRFFGWVIGGTLPAALAADWLVSAWDQNSLLRAATPATAAIEEAAGALVPGPAGPAGRGRRRFCHRSHHGQLRRAGRRPLARSWTNAGWDLDGDGLTGAPPIRCFVGQERHDSIDLALRYLGLGRPIVVPSDRQGRIDAAELDCALDRALGAADGSGPAPLLVCLQAGNLHSGAFDPFPRRSPSRKRTAPGCMWMGRSGSGPPPCLNSPP